ncbi:Duox2 [Symbiodinium natans]|uniref:Duox2 protein n=1 Tax=Symbiodinium natans TaxID=878477 RepID=A0A812TE11_9DINO|nr:Duox2 [Symbiodinium natans]
MPRLFQKWLWVLLAAVPQVDANTCTAAEIPGLLASHATSSSCWTVIVVNRQKVVYDVTRLLTNHEGGRRVIEQMCGMDGSIGFWCIHSMEDLQESINDGDAMEICRSAASIPARRLDEDEDEDDEDDDEGMRTNCAAGGSLPVPPSTAIQASDVTLHKSSDDCWTSMDDGTRKVVMDLSLYTHYHPGGKAYVLSMCGQDSTASFRAFHPFAYVTQGVNHGYIVLKGLLQGEYPAPPTTTTAAGGTPSTPSGGGSSQYAGITAAVLATHSTAGDCWGRVGSWVVDMTALRSTHPAGSSMLLCGQDVTASFRSIHADSYISRMPVMGTYDSGGSRNPSPSPGTTTGAPTPAPTPPPNTGGTSILNPTVPTESVTVISSSAMAWHAVLSDCWLAMKCKVYDMTTYIPFHTGDRYTPPGGKGAIEKLCGTDATAAFEAIHPASYIDLSVRTGAVLLGELAGCGRDTATAESTTTQTTTAAAAPVEVPQNATMWYNLSFPNLLASSVDLTSTQTEAALAIQVQHAMSAQGLVNVKAVVSNLRPGSIKATVGLQMSDIGQLDQVRLFGSTKMNTVAWMGDTPVVEGTPQLEVAYASAPAPVPAAPGASMPVYTIHQVNDHNTELDCWMAAHGKVFSFVGAAKAHPVGSFLSLGLCGVDATSTFDLHHPLSYLGKAPLSRIGGGQIGTLSSASGPDAPKTYPRPSPIHVLPNIEVALTGGSTDFLQKHNLETDCWMALHGDVYDATSMLSQHDGGRANVAALCGLDATASFDCVHAMEEIQEAVNDYGITKVGTTSTVLGPGCTFQLSAGMLPDRQITWEELAMHSTTQDCWILLGSEQIVWDVTAYLPKHTGGASSVGILCGGDATRSFDKNHKKGYMTTLAQKGGFPQGKITGVQPAIDTGSMQLTPLTMTDVAMHNIGADCWVAVHGYVLDVTSYLNRHSGGRMSIESSCGSDATASFDGASHPQSYITMMVQKRFATIKGCIGSCTSNGATPASGNGIGTPETMAGPTAEVPARQCRADEPTPPATTVTDAELKLHNTPTDCWMVLGCGVYDVSAYKHSGGDGSVHAWCGGDGTTSFVGKHPWTYLAILLNKGAVLKGQYGGSSVPTSVSRQTPLALTEIAKHNTATDCWSCIHGQVYELHFYMPDHDAGSAVIEPMCGEDATAYFAMAHAKGSLQGLPIKGSCDPRAEQAFTEQNVLDGAAFLAYILVPLMLNQASPMLMSPPMQDRVFRRPLRAKPLSGCLGNLLNSYLEMPIGVAVMLLWFLVATAILSTFWALHYELYYLPDFAGPGWIGRMTVYMISIATYLGTRRWSLAWTLYQISYEKTLKAHYVIGSVASIYMLLHGILYMVAFGPGMLPEHQVTTAYTLLACICIVFPFSINNFRVRWYSVFKVTHFLAPVIVIVANLHIMSLNVDGLLCRGFWGAMIWIGSAAIFWIGDFLYSRYDVLMVPTKVVGTPRVLPADGGPAHIAVKLRKKTTLFPGAWLSVASLDAGSALSHPFTAIVRKCGGVDKEYAEVEFLWKVCPGKTWTQALQDKIAQASPNHPFKFYMSGPYGGGLGCLEAMRVIIFVVGGVGVTPAASMVPHLIRGGKDVYVIWSCRSASLIQHISAEYFNSACGAYFDRYPDQRRIHYSGKKVDVLPPYVRKGRPNIPEIVGSAVQSALKREILDIGVFVCGPGALVDESLKAAKMYSDPGTGTHVHVHAESFQM